MTKAKEVIKHSSAIQIANDVSLLARRTWNVLLANAYDLLPSEDTYQVKLKDLAGVLEYKSNDYKLLKDILRGLRRAEVEWNLLGKDQERSWGVTGLLAHAEILPGKGVCKYSYSPFLRKMLHNPAMYAKINLSLQNQFNSKHALALYELCLDYLDIQRTEGETPFIEIEKYRRLMGVEENKYSKFKDLNKYVIKAPVNEINAVSNIRIEQKYQKKSRRVVAVKFMITQKAEFNLLPPKLSKEGDIKIGSVRSEHENPLVASLIKRRVSETDAEKLVAESSKERVEEKIDYYDWLIQQAESGQLSEEQVPKSGKWLIQAIAEDWKPPKGFVSRTEMEQQKEEEEQYRKAQRLVDKKQFEDAIAAIKRYQQNYGTPNGVGSLLGQAKEGLEKEQKQKKIEAYIDALSPEKLDSLKRKTHDRLKKLLPNTVPDTDNPIFKSILNQVAEECYETEKNQLSLLI